MELKYPWQVEEVEWSKKVGDRDTLKIGPLLVKLEKAFDALPDHLYGTEDLDDLESARDRLEQARVAGHRAALEFADQARLLSNSIGKLVPMLKKSSKDKDALNFATFAAKAADKLAADVLELSASSQNAIRKVCTRYENEAKRKEEEDKEEDKDSGKDDAKAKAKAKAKEKVPNPQLLAHNSKVRSMVNKLRGGTQPRTPFAFLQNKVRKPFDKSKPWEKKSLLHVGPRALKSCRSELEKLLLPELRSGDFVFFYGEVALVGAKGKGKLVFEFESALANPKQMKDALLYQCRYSPPFQIRKQGLEQVVEEEAEGDEADAEREDDDADGAAQPAAAADGKAGSGWQSARPSVVQDAEIAAARKALVDAQKNLRRGIGTLMERVTGAYRGTSGADLEAVKKALRRLDALHKKLDVDVAAPLDDVAKGKDAAERNRRRKAALDKVTALGTVVSGDELMADIDRNELMPGLVVVAPMKDALKKAIGALR